MTCKLSILGTGSIGRALAVGLTSAGRFRPADLVLTRRKIDRLTDLGEQGFRLEPDNRAAVRDSETVVIAVEPQQLDALLSEVRGELDSGRHLVISVVSGASIADLLRQIGKPVEIVRAMPNTSVAIGQSMTCVASRSSNQPALARAKEIFDCVGRTLVIDEELMVPATALCACGIAFFLRAIRAASQGGIEIGFHPTEALVMAAQTALGAAALVLRDEAHPERQIDAVTTPRGCTISGLNELEHRGFSSALIKGIVTSSDKARSLYSGLPE